MRDRDDIDMESWARRAFDNEPAPGLIGDDLARAHAGLTRRRRWTTGASGVAVAAAAFAIAMAPSVLPTASEQPQPAGSTDQHRKAKAESPAGDGFPDYEQRMLLLDVAKDHLDPRGEHLSNARNVQGSTADTEFGDPPNVGTKLNWRVPGEPGLGMVDVTIAPPEMSDAGLRSEIGCGWLYTCEPRELPDGSTAWIGQSDDGKLGVAYRQDDGESVWVIVDPLFGNNSRIPVSSVDVSVDQLLAFVTDDRLEFLPPTCPGSVTCEQPDDAASPGVDRWS